MTDPSTYANYIRDLAYRIREDAAEAREAKTTDPKSHDHHEGREEAFIEVLLILQGEADGRFIPREECGLDGFDPLNGPLAPPDPRDR